MRSVGWAAFEPVMESSGLGGPSSFARTNDRTSGTVRGVVFRGEDECVSLAEVADAIRCGLARIDIGKTSLTAVESAARAVKVLASDVGDLDRPQRRAKVRRKGAARTPSPGAPAPPGCRPAISTAVTTGRCS